MVSLDEIGPLTIVGGILSGYHISSEILEDKYANEAKNFSSILKNLLQVPSPELRKKAQNLRRNLQERLNQYTEIMEFYNNMIYSLRKDVVLFQDRLSSHVEQPPATPAHKDKVEKLKNKAEMARIEAKNTVEVGEQKMIATMATIVDKLKTLKQRNEEIETFKNRSSLDAFTRFRILYLYSHSHNYRYIGKKVTEEEEEIIIPKLLNIPQMEQLPDADPSGYTQEKKEIYEIVKRGLSVKKVKSKLIPINTIKEDSLPFVKLYTSLRRKNLFLKEWEKETEKLRRLEGNIILPSFFDDLKKRLSTEKEAQIKDLSKIIIQSKYPKFVDLHTLNIPKVFEIDFMQMHFDGYADKPSFIYRQILDESGNKTCNVNVIRRKSKEGFFASEKMVTGNDSQEGKCYVVVNNSFRNESGVLESPVDTQDIYDFMLTHHDDTHFRYNQERIDKLVSPPAEPEVFIPNTRDNPAVGLTNSDQRRQIIEDDQKIIIEDEIRFKRENYKLDRAFEEREKMQFLALSVDKKINQFHIGHEYEEVKKKMQNTVKISNFLERSPGPMFFQSHNQISTSVSVQLYGEKRERFDQVERNQDYDQDIITYEDYYRSPGAQPIYNFGVIKPAPKDRTKHFVDPDMYIHNNITNDTVNRYTSTSSEIDTSYTDIGFDFPRVDSETFTYLLNDDTDDLCLFFYKFMQENKYGDEDFLKQDLEDFNDRLKISNFNSYESSKNVSTSMCEFLIKNLGNPEFANFYSEYINLGGCRQGTNEELEKYQTWVKGVLSSRSRPLEEDVELLINAEGEPEEGSKMKLYRCYKLLNTIHSVLKKKYKIYRVIQSV